jgi:hypothetical protein
MIIRKNELPDYLKKKYGTAVQVSEALGVSRNSATHLLAGRFFPSDDSLRKIGFEIAAVTVAK